MAYKSFLKMGENKNLIIFFKYNKVVLVTGNTDFIRFGLTFYSEFSIVFFIFDRGFFKVNYFGATFSVTTILIGVFV